MEELYKLLQFCIFVLPRVRMLDTCKSSGLKIYGGHLHQVIRVFCEVYVKSGPVSCSKFYKLMSDFINVKVNISCTI